VTVTGAVDDMRSWLAAADVVVARSASRAASRTRCSRPWNARCRSPAAFEGIEAERPHLLVADGAGATAGAITSALGNAAYAAELGRAARDLVATTYRWKRGWRHSTRC
jgi:hypothetical protein